MKVCNPLDEGNRREWHKIGTQTMDVRDPLEGNRRENPETRRRKRHQSGTLSKDAREDEEDTQTTRGGSAAALLCSVLSHICWCEYFAHIWFFLSIVFFSYTRFLFRFFDRCIFSHAFFLFVKSCSFLTHVFFIFFHTPKDENTKRSSGPQLVRSSRWQPARRSPARRAGARTGR